MLACNLQTLHPREWELARQKYKRDLDDLNDLFGVEDDKNLNGGEEEKKRDT